MQTIGHHSQFGTATLANDRELPPGWGNVWWLWPGTQALALTCQAEALIRLVGGARRDHVLDGQVAEQVVFEQDRHLRCESGMTSKRN